MEKNTFLGTEVHFFDNLGRNTEHLTLTVKRAV